MCLFSLLLKTCVTNVKIFIIQIESLLSECFTDISIGGEYTLALTDDGKVYGWGNNSDWELCLNRNEFNVYEPVLIPGLVSKNILQVNNRIFMFVDFRFNNFQYISLIRGSNILKYLS